MDASGERPPPRASGGNSPERKGAPRPPGEGRRRRPAEGRYASWGDGLAREFCARAAHVLPTTFPVASHGGVATIARVVVARRPDAHLLCTFSHCGAHVWPDGEIVPDSPAATTAALEGEFITSNSGN